MPRPGRRSPSFTGQAREVIETHAPHTMFPHRKERVLHLHRRHRRCTVSGIFLLAAVAMLAIGNGGCETKSFLDPSELVVAKKGTLLVPILDRLNTGVEEPNEQFGNASDPTPQDLVVS